jgi:hypothetical protein
VETLGLTKALQASAGFALCFIAEALASRSLGAVVSLSAPMANLGESKRFVGRISATLELRCFERGCSSITGPLQIQPTETSSLEVSGGLGHPMAWRNGCDWYYDSVEDPIHGR